MPEPAKSVVRDQVRRTLAEDIGHADLTAGLMPDTPVTAILWLREAAVLCGQLWFEESFKQLNPDIVIHWLAAEGHFLQADQAICRIQGSSQDILSAERTAINFLQTLSGTATTTYHFCQRLKHSPVRLVDTRKTIPGLRTAQKYAVHCGGGHNHRHGLYDGVLIKENHIHAAGGIAAAIAHARQRIYHGLKIEIEVETPDEARQALLAGADILLLDNMQIPAILESVTLKNQLAPHCLLEVSGGIDMQDLQPLLDSGIDIISSGALTKNVKAIDFSLRFVKDSS